MNRMSRHLFRYKRRADNGLVTAGTVPNSKNMLRLLERMKNRIESMSPETISKEVREFGIMFPERIGLGIQRMLFKHTLVIPTLTQLLSAGGPTSLPAAYKYYAENLVDPSRMTAYMKGSETTSFRGYLKIERENKRLRMAPHTEDLKLAEDELVHRAVEEDRIYYISNRGIRSIRRKDLEGNIVFEPGYLDGHARMVIPFDRNLGLLDIEGPNITFGNLILPHSATVITALALSKLISMKMVAELDALTGLFSRRAYDDLMKYFADAYLASGQDMSLLMFDIDHFKKVNDTYGHGTGDEVLTRAASVAVTTIRTSDVVARVADENQITNGKTLARYGGEEFAILLPGANSEKAPAAAKRCREAVQDSVVNAPNGDKIRITISIGIAAFSDAKRVIENNIKVPGFEGSFSGDLKHSLISCIKMLADTALYKAKEAGRDQAVRVVTENVKKTISFERCG